MPSKHCFVYPLCPQTACFVGRICYTAYQRPENSYLGVYRCTEESYHNNYINIFLYRQNSRSHRQRSHIIDILSRRFPSSLSPSRPCLSLTFSRGVNRAPPQGSHLLFSSLARQHGLPVRKSNLRNNAMISLRQAIPGNMFDQTECQHEVTFYFQAQWPFLMQLVSGIHTLHCKEKPSAPILSNNTELTYIRD